MKRYLSLLLLFCLLLPVTASDDLEPLLDIDETEFPSYALVTETELPPLDRIDIARRLQGIIEIPAPPSTEVIRQIGEVELFLITSIDGGGIATIATRLSAVGEHIYLWAEDGIVYDEQAMTNLVSRFDIEVYEFVRNLWGSEPNPGIDGESRLHIVITQRLQNGLGGYFSASNSYPASIAPNSNQRDMMVLSSFVLMPQFADIGISAAAHEFQHLIHHGNDVNESNWLNEGLSTLTEYLLGLEQSDFVLDEFTQVPQTSMRLWGLGNNRVAEYGAPMLFMIYLYDRFGLEAVQQIAADTDNGLQSINNMLQTRNEAPVDVIFADWVLANLLRQEDGNYAYQSLINIDELDLTATVLNLPSQFSRNLDQYASHYYLYQNLDDSVTILLEMDDTVNLIPINAASGRRMWYSQRDDGSNPSLTRGFDLRNVSAAQLDFNIWYELENEWDYAYISISSDGGQTWQLQSTQLTSTGDSNGTAYGEGYTGNSETWLADTILLNDYVGQEILLRFEMVTDDAVNFSGVALDDIRLDAIGYQSDFETDDGGWLTEGWILTDNRLPQRIWLQVIENQGRETVIHRFLAQGNEEWQLDLSESTDSIYIVLSPFAPMTSQPVSYTLQVE